MSDPVVRLNAALEGRYAIDRELGEGGMATVYLADDLRHERKVALKVLKPELAAVVGADRFLAEIKTTANLQHPNILPLFDSGEADSYLFYVMPYVEGESLRQKLDRERQLPVDEAVRIAIEVADALQAAHEQGVIHRDIKPANILLSRGRPLVADFGIALAVSSAGGTRLTETGLSVGTPHYMSPEQATGDQTVGPASDIYALGAVLYEMLVGEPPYTGSTAQAILGKIIAGKLASATGERASVPRNVDAAIRKALEKLPADRFTGAPEFARALGDEQFRYGEEAAVGAGAASGPWNRLSIGFAGLATLLAVTVVVTSRPVDRPTPEVFRFSVPLGQDANLYLGPDYSGRPHRTSLAFSPDGSLLVYSVQGEDSRLYVQRLDQERADPIEGTEGAALPFFSPDGAWIGFWAEGWLRRVSVADGDIETITPADLPRGATWGDDETIVYSGSGGLFRVADTGGEAALLAAQDTSLGAFFPNNGDLIAENRRAGGLVYAQPHMLPDSETLLFHGMRSLDPQQAEIRALDLATGTQKTVLIDAMDPRYVETGHLLFMRQGTLMAVGFDVERVEVQGQPVVMIEDVMHAVFMADTRYETGAGQVAVSASGHLAYALGGVYPERPRTAVRITSAGDIVPLDMDRREYAIFRVSPDGNRLAFYARSRGSQQIWVHDLTRGTTQPLDVGGFKNGPVEWGPDGRFLAFSSDRDGDVRNLYRLAVDGSGEPERLAPSDRSQYVASWSSEGVIAFLEGEDIWILPPDGRPAPFFTSEAFEQDATFSHDRRWIAYRSNRSGRNEVYVRPYPGPEPATLISTDGGTNPAWSPDDRQIYYRQPPGVLMAVDVTPGDEFQVGRPVPFIDPWIFRNHNPGRNYDVFSDGSFVGPVEDDDGRSERERFGATELHVILNWTETLKERVPN